VQVLIQWQITWTILMTVACSPLQQARC